MGKRKRTGSSSSSAAADPPSDSMPCSSGRDPTRAEKFSDPEGSRTCEPLSSVNEIMESHERQPNSQFSLGQHHYNLSRSMFFKRSRHHYGNQYSRRNPSNHYKPSTSFGKINPSHEDKPSLKVGSRYNSEWGHRPDFTEFREKGFWRPERIRSSSSVTDLVSFDPIKMGCEICQKSLRRKPHHFGSIIAPEELSIVGVLVCGHMFHADCLEQSTRPEDARDPLCPVCSGSVPQAEDG